MRTSEKPQHGGPAPHTVELASESSAQIVPKVWEVHLVQVGGENTSQRVSGYQQAGRITLHCMLGWLIWLLHCVMEVDMIAGGGENAGALIVHKVENTFPKSAASFGNMTVDDA